MLLLTTPAPPTAAAAPAGGTAGAAAGAAAGAPAGAAARAAAGAAAATAAAPSSAAAASAFLIKCLYTSMDEADSFFVFRFAADFALAAARCAQCGIFLVCCPRLKLGAALQLDHGSPRSSV